MKIAFFLLLLFFIDAALAQNVGIGTPSPNFPLDINGRARIRFNGGTAGLFLNRQDNAALASFVGQINDTTFGIFDNPSSAWRFAFNHSKTNMGIGTLTPKFPLTFSDGLGDKISLFGGSTSPITPHYGLGIQSGLMQFYTENNAADFVFGYGNSNAFIENMRIRGDGNINIGGAVWASAANDRTIRFGDGDFVHIGETGADDRMELKASRFLFKNGSVQIEDGTQGANKIFVSDAGGVGQWRDIPQKISFRSRVATTYNLNPSTLFTVNYLDEEYDLTGDMGNVSFIAPVLGVYHFDVNIRLTLNAVVAPYILYLNINQSSVAKFQNAQIIPANYSGDYSINGSIDIYCAAGETVNVTMSQTSSAIQSIKEFSRFNGHRVN